MSKQQQEADFGDQVEELMGITRRLASAQRARSRGWDWVHVAGEIEARPVTDEDAEIDFVLALLDSEMVREEWVRGA